MPRQAVQNRHSASSVTRDLGSCLCSTIFIVQLSSQFRMFAPVPIIRSVIQSVEWEKKTLLKGPLPLQDGELRVGRTSVHHVHCCIPGPSAPC